MSPTILKKATSSKDEARVTPSKVTSAKETEVKQSNEVHMTDASALDIKRPLEQNPDSSKGSSVLSLSKPPETTVREN
ncbi:hypothetical protein IscW_ISCW012042 [Ixodes scapularis]|uniref:Uncharacterized protein n=1 Tax=Ixodes scapularis TaxID=6945 RepID=B7QCS3_IXOSC|nr:hypothetical protein IscW_ISCW012042 [Ixodes scapularis]|eukprot:XP_002413337.1 hypothetical protein IscW_ISCW012042 [Ixodes scapularis]